MSTKLAFNSYSVRDKLNNPENVEKTFRQISDLGYTSVELDYDGLLLQFEVGVLKEPAHWVGLKAFSAHTQFERLEYGIDDAIENLKAIGLEYVVVPNLPRDRFCRDEEGYLAGTGMLAVFGEKVSKNGIKFAYHNHAKEFEKFSGKTAMEIIFNESRLERLSRRNRCLLGAIWRRRSWRMDKKVSGTSPAGSHQRSGIVEGKPMTMEVGEGNMNWPYILDACKDSGVEWYIVEQDDSLRDTVESLKISKIFLEKMGIS